MVATASGCREGERVELGHDGRERRAKLVRDVGAVGPLTRQRFEQVVDQRVEGRREEVYLLRLGARRTCIAQARVDSHASRPRNECRQLCERPPHGATDPHQSSSVAAMTRAAVARQTAVTVCAVGRRWGRLRPRCTPRPRRRRRARGGAAVGRRGVAHCPAARAGRWPGPALGRTCGSRTGSRASPLRRRQRGTGTSRAACSRESPSDSSTAEGIASARCLVGRARCSSAAASARVRDQRGQ